MDGDRHEGSVSVGVRRSRVLGGCGLASAALLALLLRSMDQLDAWAFSLLGAGTIWLGEVSRAKASESTSARDTSGGGWGWFGGDDDGDDGD